MTVANTTQTKALIDNLKAVCASYGLGNDGNEFKIITQVFLYKYLNDKFSYELKKVRPDLTEKEDWQLALSEINEDEYKLLSFEIESNTAFLYPHHVIEYLFNRQNEPEFGKLFDDTLLDIAAKNNDLFAVNTDGGAKIRLFDRVTEFISDPTKRNDFARALLNKLVDFSFENIMTEGFDFFSTIFEYLVKDYNNDAGGKYAEYYTPHAVAKIMAAILVPEPVRNVTCYDPSAGSGTLLMNLAHAIGPDKCTVYSQDISQKSSTLLRLNLVLNNLVHSIENVIQGNTMTTPFHKENGALRKFDYIVSNPPFKLDFSDDVEELKKKINKERFFAGIPNIPPKKKDSMAIYTLFLQHICHSLSSKGKAAMVVPTGFLTAQSGIDKKLRQYLVDHKMLAGAVSMPSNIFATTGTNVSIIFIDKQNENKVVFIDASGLGETVKDGERQKTVLRTTEEMRIIDAFNSKTQEDGFSVTVDYDEITVKNYSYSAGMYFDVNIDYIDISQDAFSKAIKKHNLTLLELFEESSELDKDILNNFKLINYVES